MSMRLFYPLSFFTGILIPFLLLLVFTPWSANLDLAISQIFYINGTFVLHPLWEWIYVYGLWPAWFLTGLAFLGFALSFFPLYRYLRKPCLFLILTFTIGIGLIIHAGFKDQWGRPRPRQITEFGGKQAFRPYYRPHFGLKLESAKSFTSGHASMGFYFFAVALLGTIYQSRLIYGLGLGLGWGLGGLLSLTRIAQGGHFFSDTLASALIMWLTAWGFAYFFFVKPTATFSKERSEE